MINNGLDIGLSEFKKMKSTDRDILIYNNLINIRNRIGDYKLHKKVQYIWLGLLTIFVGIKRFIGF